MYKTLLITGASGAIGSEIARCAIKKYNVVVCYNKNKSGALKLLSELKKTGSAIAVQADLCCSKEVARAFREARAYFGKIDLLVNCAGISEQKMFCDLTDCDWRAMMMCNLDSAFYCCREALTDMLSKKSGKIVNIVSMWGEVGGSMEVHYSVAKAGLIGLTKALAKEVAPSNITVNAVSLGAIKSPMLDIFSQETLESIKEETPLKRLGSPIDAARAVMFLLDNSGDFITGQVLSVNGGFVI